jgi:hypothetical protein
MFASYLISLVLLVRERLREVAVHLDTSLMMLYVHVSALAVEVRL